MAKPNLTPEAEALLWKAVDQIESFPNTFCMGTWGVSLNRFRPALNECETMGCIAGHVVYASGEPFDPLLGVPGTARRLLGTDNTLAVDRLFYRDDFGNEEIESTNIRARIQYWLNTGE